MKRGEVSSNKIIGVVIVLAMMLGSVPVYNYVDDRISHKQILQLLDENPNTEMFVFEANGKKLEAVTRSDQCPYMLVRLNRDELTVKCGWNIVYKADTVLEYFRTYGEPDRWVRDNRKVRSIDISVESMGDKGINLIKETRYYKGRNGNDGTLKEVHYISPEKIKTTYRYQSENNAKHRIGVRELRKEPIAQFTSYDPYGNFKTKEGNIYWYGDKKGDLKIDPVVSLNLPENYVPDRNISFTEASPVNFSGLCTPELNFNNLNASLRLRTNNSAGFETVNSTNSVANGTGSEPYAWNNTLPSFIDVDPVEWKVNCCANYTNIIKKITNATGTNLKVVLQEQIRCDDSPVSRFLNINYLPVCKSVVATSSDNFNRSGAPITASWSCTDPDNSSFAPSLSSGDLEIMWFNNSIPIAFNATMHNISNLSHADNVSLNIRANDNSFANGVNVWGPWSLNTTGSNVSVTDYPTEINISRDFMNSTPLAIGLYDPKRGNFEDFIVEFSMKNISNVTVGGNAAPGNLTFNLTLFHAHVSGDNSETYRFNRTFNLSYLSAGEPFPNGIPMNFTGLLNISDGPGNINKYKIILELTAPASSDKSGGGTGANNLTHTYEKDIWIVNLTISPSDPSLNRFRVPFNPGKSNIPFVGQTDLFGLFRLDIITRFFTGPVNISASISQNATIAGATMKCTRSNVPSSAASTATNSSSIPVVHNLIEITSTARNNIWCWVDYLGGAATTFRASNFSVAWGGLDFTDNRLDFSPSYI